jgi:hypothetical protein
MKKILASALAIGILSSTAFAQKWSEEELAAGVKKFDYVRFAFAGVKLRVSHLYALDLDCSSIAGWAWEIVKQPEHGSAEIAPSSFFPMFTKDNPRFRCNEHKTDGLILSYTPKLGYKGPDSLTVIEIGPNGLASERTFNFNVRQAPVSITGPKQKGA